MKNIIFKYPISRFYHLFHSQWGLWWIH